MRQLFCVVFVLCLLSSAAAEEKKFSEAWLQGQWKSVADDRLFFGEIQADGLGSYTLVQPGNVPLADGTKRGKRTFKHQYKIVRIDPKKRTLIVMFKFKSGDERQDTFVFAADGKSYAATINITGTEVTTTNTYVDDKTAP